MSGSIVIGDHPSSNRRRCQPGIQTSSGSGSSASWGVLLQSPRPSPALVLGVLRQRLVVERLHVVLVPAVGLVLAEQHLLLAGGHVVPGLRRDLVRGRQVVLLLLPVVHV